MSRKKPHIFFAVAFAVCAFTVFFAFYGRHDTSAMSDATITAVRDFSVCREDSSAVLAKLNERRAYVGSRPFEKDENLMRSAEYEALYISQFLDSGEIFAEMPELMQLRESLYPYVRESHLMFTDGSECDPFVFAGSVMKLFETSGADGSLFEGDALRAGAAVVVSGGRKITVIHVSSADTYDSLPSELITEYKEETVSPFLAEPVVQTDTAAPYIYGDSLMLPLTGHEGFYDLASYADVYDDSGSVIISVMPSFIGEGFEGTVTVTASDASGNVTTKKMPVEYYSAQTGELTSDGGFACRLLSSDGKMKFDSGAHTLFTYSGSDEGCAFLYTFTKDGNVLYSFLRSEPFAVWNPDGPGNYKVTLTEISADRFTRVQIGSLEFTVDGKTMKPYSPVTLTISGDSGLVITDNGYLTGLHQGMTLDEISSAFSAKDENGSDASSGISVVMTDRNGNTVVQGENPSVSTGAVITVSVNDYEYLKVTAVLYGDLTGDGKIDISDFAKMRYAILGKVTLEGCWFEAANIAARPAGKIDISDFAMLRYQLLGKTQIQQTN